MRASDTLMKQQTEGHAGKSLVKQSPTQKEAAKEGKEMFFRNCKVWEREWCVMLVTCPGSISAPHPEPAGMPPAAHAALMKNKWWLKEKGGIDGQRRNGLMRSQEEVKENFNREWKNGALWVIVNSATLSYSHRLLPLLFSFIIGFSSVKSL